MVTPRGKSSTVDRQSERGSWERKEVHWCYGDYKDRSWNSTPSFPGVALTTHSIGTGTATEVEER
ncbi:hypothetical protein [Anaplasma marginale]|uniref:hypothetical protein n=1 Tax=Anaplasma marginale TaxID=770 RepID=UPI001402D2AD|nr:hypothetical protein [Anaplasma marginale]